MKLSKEEKDNRLTLVKKLLVKRSKWKDAVPYINEAFDIIKPVNFKEFILFLLNKILKRL